MGGPVSLTNRQQLVTGLERPVNRTLTRHLSSNKHCHKSKRVVSSHVSNHIRVRPNKLSLYQLKQALSQVKTPNLLLVLKPHSSSTKQAQSKHIYSTGNPTTV